MEKNVRYRDFLTELKREENPAPWHNLARSSPLTTSSIPYKCRNCASMRSTISISFSKIELIRYHMVITALIESLFICFVHTETFWWRSMCLYMFSTSRIERCTYLTTMYNIMRHVKESLVFVHTVYFARCYLNTVFTHVVKTLRNWKKTMVCLLLDGRPPNSKYRSPYVLPCEIRWSATPHLGIDAYRSIISYLNVS